MNDLQPQPDPAEMTLDELRPFLAPHIADAAIFDGWTQIALDEAARIAGVDGDVARLAFSGGAMGHDRRLDRHDRSGDGG